jgi:hypothetical protein
MGTNYYLATKICECCNRSDKEYHIGKSSWGWSFTFQGYKYDGLTSWERWKDHLQRSIDDKCKIVDEYGEYISFEDFVQMIETYKAPGYVREDGHKNLQHNEEGRKGQWQYFNPDRDWDDEMGYAFTMTEFS